MRDIFFSRPILNSPYSRPEKHWELDENGQPTLKMLDSRHRAEFLTPSRPALVAAVREASDGGFDVLIACVFNYDAHSSESAKMGSVPVLKARMNADLHMAEDLKNTGKGNLFVIFCEPDITVLPTSAGQLRVKVNGVDVFHPNTGEVRNDRAVPHAYFLGANDPNKALKTTLKAEINEEAWATLNNHTSRAFDKPYEGVPGGIMANPAFQPQAR